MHKCLTWVGEATRLPIAFAQVREDSLLDLALLNQFGGDARMLMVASGGCTAASLVASGRLASLHLVDFNPAQLSLTRLKLHLLKTAPPNDRMAILGHASMPSKERLRCIHSALRELDIPLDALGPEATVAELGPDHAGRYELLFAQLRLALEEVAPELESLLSLRDCTEQARRAAPETILGCHLDRAFAETMALPNLIRLFGPEATANRVEDFSVHFARRTRHVLATLPAAENPYLSQMLLGRFNNGITSHWLNAACPESMPQITWSQSLMRNALAKLAPESFDVIHLSNILDWLSLENARETLAAAWRALAKGGTVVIRQLNSTLDIPAADPQFNWLADEACRLHAQDRSFFYRQLHIGQKTAHATVSRHIRFS